MKVGEKVISKVIKLHSAGFNEGQIETVFGIMESPYYIPDEHSILKQPLKVKHRRSKRRRKRYTVEEINTIKTLKVKGVRNSVIAKKMRRTRNAIRNFINVHKKDNEFTVPRKFWKNSELKTNEFTVPQQYEITKQKRKFWKNSELETIKKMFQVGATYKEIAKHFDVSPRSIYQVNTRYIKDRMGVRTKPVHGRVEEKIRNFLINKRVFWVSGKEVSKETNTERTYCSTVLTRLVNKGNVERNKNYNGKFKYKWFR